MGGRIALEFTLTNQDLVNGLILVGAVGVQENKDRLEDISLPCLAVWGEEDSISPLVNGHLLQQGIKDAELTVIRGATHPCYLDQPDEWHRILLGFLTEKFPV
jgi:abhydrolase domain-containing protein 14